MFNNNIITFLHQLLKLLILLTKLLVSLLVSLATSLLARPPVLTLIDIRWLTIVIRLCLLLQINLIIKSINILLTLLYLYRLIF